LLTTGKPFAILMTVLHVGIGWPVKPEIEVVSTMEVVLKINF